MEPDLNQPFQITCPGDESQQVIELGKNCDGEIEVAWCSQGLGHPNCSQSCLKEFKKVGYIMLKEVPYFERRELTLLNLDQSLAKFEGLPFDRLPVLEDGKVVGSLKLSEIALWKDNRDFRAQLSMKSWAAPEPDLEQSLRPASGECLLHWDDSWQVAVEQLLKCHENEAFVIDEEGKFVGVVYARQLLRLLSRD